MDESAHFLVLGAGGLGCPALLGLSAGGARHITVVDHDVVEASNLPRQVLYSTAEVGLPKAGVACRALRGRNPDLDATPLQLRLDSEQLARLFDRVRPGTVVLEGTDCPQLKFAANDLCLERGLPLVIGAALRWRGQVLAVRHGAACYRCVYEAPPPAELAPACSAVGVLGAAVGTMGYWMATLAFQLAAHQDVAGRLLAISFLDATTQRLQPAPRSECPACGATARSDAIPSPAAEPA